MARAPSGPRNKTASPLTLRDWAAGAAGSCADAATAPAGSRESVKVLTTVGRAAPALGGATIEKETALLEEGTHLAHACIAGSGAPLPAGAASAGVGQTFAAWSRRGSQAGGWWTLE